LKNKGIIVPLPPSLQPYFDASGNKICDFLFFNCKVPNYSKKLLVCIIEFKEINLNFQSFFYVHQALVGKPKLFFFEACRGEAHNTGMDVQTKARYLHKFTIPHDIVFNMFFLLK